MRTVKGAQKGAQEMPVSFAIIYLLIRLTTEKIMQAKANRYAKKILEE